MKNYIYEQVEEFFPNVVKIFDKKETKLMETIVKEGGDHESREEVVEEEEPELTDHEYIMRDPLLFGDYRNAMNEDEPRYYEDLLDYDAIYFLLQEIIEEYNERRGKIQLVLFEDALEHLTRIHRGIRLHKGHMLIIGVGGSGKQSLTRLASFAAGCEMFEIMLSRGYNENSFKEDLKKMFNILGVDNKNLVFLFTEAQIAKEGFLEYVNNVLAIGMVPALFNDEEKDAITGNCRAAAKEAGFGITKLVCRNLSACEKRCFLSGSLFGITSVEFVPIIFMLCCRCLRLATS